MIFNLHFRVFVLPIFEVEQNQTIPRNKSELIELTQQGMAVWFHYKICPTCHTIPEADKWLNLDDGTEMKVVSMNKRQGQYDHWEPIYIGTNDEPFYDERLSWEGKSDKMTQSYIMCLLDYDFSVLSDAFLIHKPGIKTIKEAARENMEKLSKDLITTTILKEIKLFYGHRSDCKL